MNNRSSRPASLQSLPRPDLRGAKWEKVTEKGNLSWCWPENMNEPQSSCPSPVSPWKQPSEHRVWMESSVIYKGLRLHNPPGRWALDPHHWRQKKAERGRANRVQLCLFLSVCWASHLTSLCLSFLIGKPEMRVTVITIPPSEGR